MNQNKTAKAGAHYKVLALIASLSMILAGFAAGLMASPASAGDKKHSEHSHSDREHDQTKCENDGGHWVPGDGGSSSSSSTSADVSLEVVAPAEAAHCDDSEQEECEAPTIESGSDHEWVKDGGDWNCEPKDKRINGHVDICHRAGGSGNWISISPDFSAVYKQAGVNIQGGHANPNHQDGQDIIAPIIVDGFTYFEGQNWNTETEAFLKGGCVTPDPCDVVSSPTVADVDPCEGPRATLILDCDLGWSVSVKNLSDDDVIVVKLDGNVVGGTTVDDEHSWSDSDSTPLVAGETHELQVWVNGKQVGKTADATCPASPVAVATLTCATGVDVSLTGYPEGYRITITLDGDAVVDFESVTDPFVYNSGQLNQDVTHTAVVVLETEEEPMVTLLDASLGVCSTPPPPACTVDCNPVVTEQPPVETPVVVAAATVEAPVAVAVPAPATVAAPAPATVAVPAAATLPAAVPAGNGSQAPGLPMWALAMIAVGVLGAGFAGKSILAAGK